MKVGDLVQVRHGYGTFYPSENSRAISDGDIGIIVGIEDEWKDQCSEPDEKFIYCMINGHGRILFEAYGLKVINSYTA